MILFKRDMYKKYPQFSTNVNFLLHKLQPIEDLWIQTLSESCNLWGQKLSKWLTDALFSQGLFSRHIGLFSLRQSNILRTIFHFSCL